MSITVTPSLGSPAQIERVRRLDPLSADAACLRVPAMNAAGDVTGLRTTLLATLPETRTVPELGIDEALAAMRDIGIFLGSLKRHGVEPCAAVPGLPGVLAELGSRTDMVPRDTVHHYCTWNPQGRRQRSYTGDAQETVMQNSVRHSFLALRSGVELCQQLSDVEPDDPDFATLLNSLADELTAFVDVIDMVTKKVSPKFFARTLRPYFEEIDIAGASYLGPAAAQVPLWLIDQAMWASDRGDPDYELFLRDSLPYNLPDWRDRYERWSRESSQVTRLLAAYGDNVEEAERRMPALRESAAAMARVLRTVLIFRGRHLGVARRAYAADVAVYPVGSGGGSVDLLQQITQLTRENANAIKPAKHAPVKRDAAEAVGV